MSVEKVLAVMSASDKPLTAGKIAELAGIDKKEVEKAMNVLKKEGKIVSPVRCAWEIAK
ncbi:MAG: transcriptional regulator [Prolixibacteraceae bacterium]|jgi:DNA-binding transcriptional regulator GbsR (MarR family)|nr:transcriptional regulator [Prolixibacteraceae bacterium]